MSSMMRHFLLQLGNLYGMSRWIFPSLLFAWKIVKNLEFIHHNKRILESVRQRFARKERGNIDISRFDPQPGSRFRYSFHHVQHRALGILDHVKQPALASDADSLPALEIASHKAVILRYGTAHSNGRVRRRAPSVAVKHLRNAMKRTFTYHRAVL
jgi:hypothetical protein